MNDEYRGKLSDSEDIRGSIEAPISVSYENGNTARQIARRLEALAKELGADLSLTIVGVKGSYAVQYRGKAAELVGAAKMCEQMAVRFANSAISNGTEPTVTVHGEGGPK